MIDVKTVNGQTIWDIAIQKYGSIEGLVNIIPSVNSITGQLPVNLELSLPENDDPNDVSFYFENRKPVATFADEILIRGIEYLETPEGDLILDDEGRGMVFI